MPEYFSQFGEDKWIHENLILPEEGFFVEVGAYDGVASSNTLCFERIGWHGFVVEALPDMAKECVVNRLCPAMCYAVGDEDGLGHFYRHPTDLGQSSLTCLGEMFLCNKARLRTLLEHFRHPKITLLSIDTEGTELDVWRGLWPYRPQIVVIEFLSGNGINRAEEILQVVKADGYWEVHRTEANLILVGNTGLERNPKVA
jgi:FkbM family methyltransferase